jgi:hypothetical protein
MSLLWLTIDIFLVESYLLCPYKELVDNFFFESIELNEFLLFVKLFDLGATSSFFN